MGDGTLRFVTLNLWGENGPVDKRMALVASELKVLAPDVVALQEVRVSPSAGHQAEILATAAGLTPVFAPATKWGGGEEGLAILSRFPVQAFSATPLPHSTVDEGRILLSVCLASTFGPLWVHVTHLSYREHEGTRREDQVQFAETVMAEKAAAAARAAAPASANPHVFMGDLNAPPSCDEIRWLRGETSLGGRRVFYQDAWEVLHPEEPGYTWAKENPFRARMDWLRANRRLDYVFVSAPRRDGRGHIRRVSRVFDQPDAEGNYPSDHYGVMAEVQMAPTPGGP